MALGGGAFTAQNKKLPGAYINFVSAKRPYEVGGRGVAALALELDWGKEGEVFSLDAESFQKKSLVYFGYPASHEKMKGLRDLFRHCKKAYLYRLNSGDKAYSLFGEARYSGVQGNAICNVIQKNVDDYSLFEVKTLVDQKLVDFQTVSSMEELKDNDFIVWRRDAALEETAFTPMLGGANGGEATGVEYETFLNRIEPYNFHTLGCLSISEEIKALYAAFTKRMREEVGAKFQTVLFQKSDADYEGVISVENQALGEDVPSASAVYWVTGAQAGCKLYESCTNMTYDGEFDLDLEYTQLQLENALDEGKFIFHRVGDKVNVLEDVNTLISETEGKGADFKSNQTVRVSDQISNNIGALFNSKYNGKVPNDAAGRVSLWNDIVTLDKELEKIRAIENFDPELVTVERGETRQSVAVTQTVNVVNAMSQLYMTVVIS